MLPARLYSEPEETYRNHLRDRAQNFMRSFIGKEQGRTIDVNLFTFFEDLERGSFWHVLRTIDENPGARENARKTFKECELSEMLTICLNQALVFPEVTAHPGSFRGNSIVYPYAVNPSSLVGEATKEMEGFVESLQNGRFWEALSEMRDWSSNWNSYAIARDVLLNHFESLDPAYLPRGLEIVARQDAQYGAPERIPCFDVSGLSADAVPPYGSFLLQIVERNKSSGLVDEGLKDRLFKPFVKRVLTRDEDDRPDFPNYKHPNATSLLGNLECQRILKEDRNLEKAYGQLVRHG